MSEYYIPDKDSNVSHTQYNSMYAHTVKPLKRGHFGTMAFVLSSEVVLFLEVALFLLLNLEVSCVYEFYGPRPYIDKLREVVASLWSSGLV